MNEANGFVNERDDAMLGYVLGVSSAGEPGVCYLFGGVFWPWHLDGGRN